MTLLLIPMNKLVSRDVLPLSGWFLRIRCATLAINLIPKAGLEELYKVMVKFRDSVEYRSVSYTHLTLPTKRIV